MKALKPGPDGHLVLLQQKCYRERLRQEWLKGENTEVEKKASFRFQKSFHIFVLTTHFNQLILNNTPCLKKN